MVWISFEEIISINTNTKRVNDCLKVQTYFILFYNFRFRRTKICIEKRNYSPISLVISDDDIQLFIQVAQKIIETETYNYPEVEGLSPSVFDNEICNIWNVFLIVMDLHYDTRSTIWWFCWEVEANEKKWRRSHTARQALSALYVHWQWSLYVWNYVELALQDHHPTRLAADSQVKESRVITAWLVNDTKQLVITQSHKTHT